MRRERERREREHAKPTRKTHLGGPGVVRGLVGRGGRLVRCRALGRRAKVAGERRLLLLLRAAHRLAFCFCAGCSCCCCTPPPPSFSEGARQLAPNGPAGPRCQRRVWCARGAASTRETLALLSNDRAFAFERVLVSCVLQRGGQMCKAVVAVVCGYCVRACARWCSFVCGGARDRRGGAARGRKELSSASASASTWLLSCPGDAGAHGASHLMRSPTDMRTSSSHPTYTSTALRRCCSFLVPRRSART